MGRPKLARISKSCRHCGKNFETTMAINAIGKGIFCSHSCKGKNAAQDSKVLFENNRLAPNANGCMNYQRVHKKNGYGTIYVNQKYVKAHRFAWELYRGSIPDGLYVLHKCDNRACCNPDHLFLGTLADNNSDRDKKGRFTVLRGSNNGHAILTDEQVKEIKLKIKQKMSNPQLAIEYNVHHSTISKIRNNKHWRHI